MIPGFGWHLIVRGAALFAFVWTFASGAVDEVVNPRDTLVFKDGDRVQGRVMSQSPDMIVFQSDRFGELRVKTGEGIVIPAETVPGAEEAVAAATPAESPPGKKAGETAKTEANQTEADRATAWDRYSPGVLTAHVRRFFGPWKGKFAFSTEIVSDSAERTYYSLETSVSRKWARDEVQMVGRYDFVETNEVPTTDMLKASGTWRHEFSKARFAHYRPTVEWNRASRRQGMPNDYVLLQQELGAGFHLVTTPTRKLRAGVSNNFFNIWNSAPTPEHSSRMALSAFEEIELKLPWQMGLTQRGVWYPVENRRDGWDNRIELNKRLTETLTTSLRHEMRRHNPDGSAQDYDKLKLLFGLDF